VVDHFNIERYSHVMHIASEVQGHIRHDLDAVDALKAGFPAGTLTGAPKIRAMEIIDELEPTRRGPYGGAAGYISGNGDMDSCIVLRTALIKDDMLYIQAGAGVVYDSVDENEYQECVNKAMAVIRAAAEAVEMSED
jgi:anthranilate synthase component 1